MTMLSANHVAWAIVQACRETGENALVVAEQRKPQSRARHYALQALKVVFPDVSRERLAWMCGCSGNPKYYSTNSTNGIQRFVGGPHKGERIHRFWKEEVFERVIAAVRTCDPVVAEERGRRPQLKLSAKVDSIVEPTRPAATPGKRKLHDMLAEAVRNTAAMTPRE
jgi:hypothetical protein